MHLQISWQKQHGNAAGSKHIDRHIPPSTQWMLHNADAVHEDMLYCKVVFVQFPGATFMPGTPCPVCHILSSMSTLGGGCNLPRACIHMLRGQHASWTTWFRCLIGSSLARTPHGILHGICKTVWPYHGNNRNELMKASLVARPLPSQSELLVLARADSSHEHCTHTSNRTSCCNILGTGACT